MPTLEPDAVLDLVGEYPLEEPPLVGRQAELLVRLQHTHLTAKTLERLLTPVTVAEDYLALLHLLALCPGCRRNAGYLLRLVETGTVQYPAAPWRSDG